MALLPVAPLKVQILLATRLSTHGPASSYSNAIETPEPDLVAPSSELVAG